jgi:NADH:ubiquinone oxidoreductase subunit 4 (subunit M)
MPLKLSSEDTKPEPLLKWAVFVRNHKIHFDVFDFGISIALPTTFNFIGEFTVLYSLSQINIWFAILGGTTIILGAYYMLKMFQHAMLGETNTKSFADVTFNEGIGTYNWCFVLLGCIKTNYRFDYAKSGKF